MSSQAQLFQSLQDQGWAYSDTLIPQEWQSALLTQSQHLWRAGHFRDARIGRHANNVLNVDIRGDAICWIDPVPPDPVSQDSGIVPFLRWVDDFRNALNEHFYLGLRSSELHFAHYEPGRGYTKHIDQHRSNIARKISFVLYLNDDWQNDDGGELCLYSDEHAEQPVQRLLPIPARLVVFRSDTIPHEVLPGRKARWSLAGWLRTDASL